MLAVCGASWVPLIVPKAAVVSSRSSFSSPRPTGAPARFSGWLLLETSWTFSPAVMGWVEPSGLISSALKVPVPLSVAELTLWPWSSTRPKVRSTDSPVRKGVVASPGQAGNRLPAMLMATRDVPVVPGLTRKTSVHCPVHGTALRVRLTRSMVRVLSVSCR